MDPARPAFMTRQILKTVGAPSGSSIRTYWQNASAILKVSSRWRQISKPCAGLSNGFMHPSRLIRPWKSKLFSQRRNSVLSTPKFRRLVLAAKQRRFTIHLIYVLLSSSQLNIERVRLRVAKGGHDVPKDKIVERRERSLAQLPWFLAQTDEAWLFDNSGASPELIGSKSDGKIKLKSSALPEIKEAARLATLEMQRAVSG